jgi:hypothetical protein
VFSTVSKPCQNLTGSQTVPKPQTHVFKCLDQLQAGAIGSDRVRIEPAI